MNSFDLAPILKELAVEKAKNFMLKEEITKQTTVKKELQEQILEMQFDMYKNIEHDFNNNNDYTQKFIAFLISRVKLLTNQVEKAYETREKIVETQEVEDAGEEELGPGSKRKCTTSEDYSSGGEKNFTKDIVRLLDYIRIFENCVQNVAIKRKSADAQMGRRILEIIEKLFRDMEEEF